MAPPPHILSSFQVLQDSYLSLASRISSLDRRQDRSENTTSLSTNSSIIGEARNHLSLLRNALDVDEISRILEQSDHDLTICIEIIILGLASSLWVLDREIAKGEAPVGRERGLFRPKKRPILDEQLIKNIREQLVHQYTAIDDLIGCVSRKELQGEKDALETPLEVCRDKLRLSAAKAWRSRLKNRNAGKEGCFAEELESLLDKYDDNPNQADDLLCSKSFLKAHAVTDQENASSKSSTRSPSPTRPTSTTTISGFAERKSEEALAPDLSAPDLSEDFNSLHIAIHKGDIRAVAEALKLGADVDGHQITNRSTIPTGITPLGRAALRGNLNIVELLVEFGADINMAARQEDGFTALHLATVQNHVEIVRHLLPGADSTVRSVKGQTALHCACVKGNAQMIKALLEGSGQRAREIQDDRGRTPMHVASILGHADIVKILLRAGCSTGIKDSEGKNALSYAAKRGHKKVVPLILDSIKVTQQSAWGFITDDALNIACRNGDLAIITLMIKKGRGWLSNDHGNSPLHYSTLGGPEAIKLMLKHRPTLSKKKNKYGETALHWAARIGCIESCAVLIKHNKPLGVTQIVNNSRGLTPLHIAAQNGNLEALKMFMQPAPNDTLEYRTHAQWTTLHLAIDGGHEDVIKHLISEGGSTKHVSDSGISQLTIMAKSDNVAAMKKMMDLGTTWEKTKLDGTTPVHEMVTAGCVKGLRFLLQKGANPNDKTTTGMTPLFRAVYSFVSLEKVKECIDTLIEYGAKIDEEDPNGYTPLLTAALEGKTEMVKIFVSHGANIQHRLSEGADSLRLAAGRNHLQTVKYLLEQGANPDSRSRNQNAALHFVSQEGMLMMASLLLDFKAPIESKNHEGVTPLQLAVHMNKLDVVKLLLNRGADPDTCITKGYSVLQRATYRDYRDVARVLIESGADVNMRNLRGTTALHSAAIKGFTEMCKMLLDMGADRSLLGAYGDDEERVTPAQLARKWDFVETAIAIEEWGEVTYDACEDE